MKFFKIGKPAPPQEEYRAKPVIVTTERTVMTAVGGGSSQLRAVINDKGDIKISTVRYRFDPVSGSDWSDCPIGKTIDYQTLTEFTVRVGEQSTLARETYKHKLERAA